MRTEIVKTEVQRLLRQVPFRPFCLSFENGDQVVLEHPENIAFDPGGNGSRRSRELHVVSSRVRYASTFEAVTSVAAMDEEDETP